MGQRSSKRKRSTTADRRRGAPGVTPPAKRQRRDQQPNLLQRLLRWATGASTAVKSLGALAAAIVAIGGAVKLLKPEPNPHDDVAISSIRAIRQPLEDFHPGIRHDPSTGGSAGPPSGTIVVAAGALRLLAQAGGDDASGAADSPATTSGEAPSDDQPGTTSGSATTGTGSTDGSDTTTGTPPGDTTTGTPPGDTVTHGGGLGGKGALNETGTNPSAKARTSEPPAERAGADVLAPAVPIILPEATASTEFTTTAQTTIDQAQPLVPGVDIKTCEVKINGACVAVLFMLTTVSVDPAGKPVAPDVAAHRVAAMLNRTRTTTVRGRRVPQGLYVTARIRLVALRDKAVSLTWSVLPVDGKGGLGRGWDGPNLSYRLKATDDDDHVFVPLWIPLPKRKGQYVVRLAVFRGDTTLGQADSDVFR